MREVLTKQAKLLFPGLVVVAMSATIWYSGISVVWVIAVLAALLINGFVATWEDDVPGGFNNPDRTSTPTYVLMVGRISKIACALLCGTVAAVILATASRGAIDWVTELLFALASASLGFGLIWPRRTVQWLALLFAIIVFACAIWRGSAASNTGLQPSASRARVAAK